MNKEGIKIKGHIGTFYVIDEAYFNGTKVYLLESEVFGDDAACIIIDSKMNVLKTNVWNGFDDLEE